MVAFSSFGGESLQPIPEDIPDLGEASTPQQSSGMASVVIGRARVFFAVDVNGLQPNEFVMVCGSIDQLGRWDPQSGLVLCQDPFNPRRWKGEVHTIESSVKFRYLVGYKLCSDNGERMIISRWECFRVPRSISVTLEQRATGGVCHEAFVDLFGYYAGQRRTSEGWLTNEEENQVLLRIHGNALKFYKTQKDRKNCRIKITPLDVRNRSTSLLTPRSSAGSEVVDEEEDEEDSSTSSGPYPSHSDSEVAILSDASPRFHRQTPTGTVFNNNVEYLVFKTHSVAVEFLAFYVEIFSDEGKRIGACYALPSSLNDTFGSTYLPFINSTGRPIGQISLEYLFIRKLKRAIPFQPMESTYARHWKKRNTLEVGHRGAGNSYTKFAMARENTIASLNTAAKNGADFVEFDVQLTKDKVAVIYHDFHVLVSVTKRGAVVDQPIAEAIDFHEIAVKDLKLNQVKLLMLDHVSKKAAPGSRPREPEEMDDYKPFPTLVEALLKVDPDVGFNVEVKYPMMQTTGEHECEHYFERNEFVDIILADIMNSANGRRIVFSSFDPDICQMISMKQSMYPVLFLCIGMTKRYIPFSDQRTSTSLTAVNFAASADILGVNFNSEDLLNDPFPVQRASELGLVNFVWGDDLDKKETIDYFKKGLGVDGLIYDRIGEDVRRRNVFIVEREQKRALFSLTSGANTPRAGSPTESVKSSNSSNGGATPTTNKVPYVDRLRIQSPARISS